MTIWIGSYPVRSDRMESKQEWRTLRAGEDSKSVREAGAGQCT